MNKKRKKAAALKYNQLLDKAPKLIAKGQGNVAEEIIKRAKEYNIYIKEDSDLIEVLYALDINEEIPESLYMVIAKLLTELYELNKKYKK
jgi:flagellar biosynthesis protein